MHSAFGGVWICAAFDINKNFVNFTLGASSVLLSQNRDSYTLTLKLTLCLGKELNPVQSKETLECFLFDVINVIYVTYKTSKSQTHIPREESTFLLAFVLLSQKVTD